MKKLICGFIMFLLLISNAKASDCSNADKDRLQKLANNITVNLEYVPTINGSPHYKVTLVGISNELSVASDENLTNVNEADNGFREFTYKLKKSGKKYSFSIRGNNTCNFETLRTITVNTPYYNVYHNDEVCEGAKEYSLCQKWSKVNILYEDFVQKVNEYKENNHKVEENNKNDIKEEINFLKNFQKYYWPSLIALIITLTLLIILWLKENKKNKL